MPEKQNNPQVSPDEPQAPTVSEETTEELSQDELDQATGGALVDYFVKLTFNECDGSVRPVTIGSSGGGGGAGKAR